MWGKRVGSRVCSGLGLLGKAITGSLRETPLNHPGGCWTVRRHQILLWGWGKVQSGVPMDLLESGSDSWATPMLLGTAEEPVLGSLGHMESRDSGLGSKGKGQGGESSGRLLPGQESLASSGS